MTQTLRKDENVLQRVLITVAILLFTRIVYFIPVPGVEWNALCGFYQRHIQMSGGGWLDLLELLHIGKLRNVSVCALGIMPFINACIIVQIVGFLVPGVNWNFFYARNGRQRMMFATLVVTLALSVIHAYGVSLDLELLDKFPRFQILHASGAFFRFAAVCSMSAAVLLFVLLAELVNRFGIGNGAGVIFISEVLMRVVFAVDQLALFYGRHAISLQQLLLVAATVIAFYYFMRFVTRFREEIKFTTPENEIFFISVKPFWPGVWPLILSEVIFSFFEIGVDAVSFIAVCATIAFFTLLYLKIVYQPRRFYELLLAHHCTLCEPQTKRIEDHLNRAVVRGMSLSIMLFIVLYYVPVLLPLVFKISFLSAGVFGAFGVIVIAGVYYDTMRQIKFFHKLAKLPVKEWSLLNVTCDEAESEVKKACLRGHGIMTEINPSHFSWGLPIRTVASGYFLYVPSPARAEALAILETLQSVWREKAV